MPTWLAVLVCCGAFAPLLTISSRTPEAVLLALLFCLATFANLYAGLLADRDERRRVALRAMYRWDWVALGVSAVGGGAALLLAVSRSHEFVLGLLMATLAAILGLSTAIRHHLAALAPSLAQVEDVFE